MNAIDREIVRSVPSPTGYWNALLAMVIVLAGCGSRSAMRLDWAGGTCIGGDARGEGDVPGGGGEQTSTGGNGGYAGGSAGAAGSTGGTEVATGGVTAQGGSGGGQGGAADALSPDGLGYCAAFTLYDDISRGLSLGPLGYCGPTDRGNPNWGTVILDSDGRVVDITLLGTATQGLLAGLANERWPCLAGMTIQYSCFQRN